MSIDDRSSADLSLADALTREHHEIDAGIEAFIAHSRTTDPVREWAGPLLEAMAALRRHIYLEEAIVFPRIRQGALMMPVMVMVREHGSLWQAMDELERELSSPTADEEPARSRIVSACHRMLELLERHNSKEEPIIYPHLDSDLDEGARAQLRDFLSDGRMPDGWVCERA